MKLPAFAYSDATRELQLLLKAPKILSSPTIPTKHKFRHPWPVKALGKYRRKLLGHLYSPLEICVWPGTWTRSFRESPETSLTFPFPMSFLLGSARRRLGRTISSRWNKVCPPRYCPCSSPCAAEGTGPTARPARCSLQSLWGLGIPHSLSWAGARLPWHPVQYGLGEDRNRVWW